MTTSAESAASAPDPAPSVPKRRQAIGSGRAGRVRAQLVRALEEARAADRMTAEHEVQALLAERYAAIVDRAARDGEGAELLRAGDKLLELMRSLPIRPPGGGGSGDSGDGRGKLIGIMDSGPTVGHAANA